MTGKIKSTSERKLKSGVSHTHCLKTIHPLTQLKAKLENLICSFRFVGQLHYDTDPCSQQK